MDSTRQGGARKSLLLKLLKLLKSLLLKLFKFNLLLFLDVLKHLRRRPWLGRI